MQENWRSVERLSKSQKASQLQLLLGKAAQYTNFLSKKLSQHTDTSVCLFFYFVYFVLRCKYKSCLRETQNAE